jgi:hypothetical protein
MLELLLRGRRPRARTRSARLQIEALDSRSSPALVLPGLTLEDDGIGLATLVSGPSTLLAAGEVSTIPDDPESPIIDSGLVVSNEDGDPSSLEAISGTTVVVSGLSAVDAGPTGGQPFDYCGNDPSGNDPNLTGSQGPWISNFSVQTFTNGNCLFTGIVTDDKPPGGLIVRFGGQPVSLGNQTTTTAADGTFMLSLQMRTDGADTGTATAVTTDGDGNVSNTATVFVNPIP